LLEFIHYLIQSHTVFNEKLQNMAEPDKTQLFHHVLERLKEEGMLRENALPDEADIGSEATVSPVRRRVTQSFRQGLAVFLLKRYRVLPRQGDEFARRGALPCALRCSKQAVRCSSAGLSSIATTSSNCPAIAAGSSVASGVLRITDRTAPMELASIRTSGSSR
jgi:hypothetical protein